MKANLGKTLTVAGLIGIGLALALWQAAPAAAHHGRGSHARSSNAAAPGGGPPPWAPAHGYRRKHGGGPGRNQGGYDSQDGDVAYQPPFEIDQGNCNRGMLGAALGGTAGGLVGSQIGKGDERVVAIVAGSIIGIIIGGTIGRTMDEVDQNCLGQVLEHAPDQETIRWNNPETGADYTMTPVRTGQDGDGKYCREYQTTVIIDGRQQQAYGTACRQPDGSWERRG